MEFIRNDSKRWVTSNSCAYGWTICPDPLWILSSGRQLFGGGQVWSVINHFMPSWYFCNYGGMGKLSCASVMLGDPPEESLIVWRLCSSGICGLCIHLIAHVTGWVASMPPFMFIHIRYISSRQCIKGTFAEQDAYHTEFFGQVLIWVIP